MARAQPCANLLFNHGRVGSRHDACDDGDGDAHGTTDGLDGESTWKSNWDGTASANGKIARYCLRAVLCDQLYAHLECRYHVMVLS